MSLGHGYSWVAGKRGSSTTVSKAMLSKTLTTMFKEASAVEEAARPPAADPAVDAPPPSASKGPTCQGSGAFGPYAPLHDCGERTADEAAEAHG